MNILAETYGPRLLVMYGSILLLLFRISFLLINKKRNKVLALKREFLFDLFIIYILFVLSITLLPITIYYVEQPFKMEPIINLIPFSGINEINKITLENIFGNLLLLTPLVIFLKLLYSNKFKSLKKCIIVVFTASIFIEASQYLEMFFGITFARITDITDIILNCSGGFIGYYLYTTLFKDNDIKN